MLYAIDLACGVCSCEVKLGSLGFDVTSKSRGFRFWERGRLVDLNMLQHDCDAPVVKSQLSKIAQFLSVVARSPEIVSCGVVGVDVIKTLDDYPVAKLLCIFRLTSND